MNNFRTNTFLVSTYELLLQILLSQQKLGTFLENKVQANLDLRNSIIPFLNPVMLHSRKIYVLDAKPVVQKKCPMLVNLHIKPKIQ